MEKVELDDILCIRYTKIHFLLEILEDCVLPKNKASAIRGGIGEMLLRTNCIRDRNCDVCDFANACIKERFMNSPMAIQPKFMKKGESIGNVFECEDYREKFKKGDILKFNLILFGERIVYFAQCLNALYGFGNLGLGKNRGRFRIYTVNNTLGNRIMSDNNVDIGKYDIHHVKEYVDYRLENIKEKEYYRIKFQTPHSLSYMGEITESFDEYVLFSNIIRRIYILNCFEGFITQEYELQNYCNVLLQKTERVVVPRYSNRQKAKMMLKGSEGQIIIRNVDIDQLKLLLAGELIHIGKNTSFGFGRYRVFDDV